MKIRLANPRGFCAGVDRAIEVVLKALEVYGAPVYVRHEIVHNAYVCDGLREKGAIFVDELSEVPDGGRVIFSAHGVSQKVLDDADQRGLESINATCPLVTKVHMEAKLLSKRGCRLVLIGHAGHPEVEGTLGQVREPMALVQTPQDVDHLEWSEDEDVAYLTQTTLSVDETREVIDALKRRFKNLKSPPKKDICYATTNRQNAVKELMSNIDLLLVLGAQNSSNSRRLQELGVKHGLDSYLINSVDSIDPSWFDSVTTVGITSGASAPEILVQQVIHYLQQQYGAEVIEGLERQAEDVHFGLPKVLKEVKG